MRIHFQPSFFDIEKRTGKLTEMGDALVGLNARIGPKRAKRGWPVHASLPLTYHPVPDIA